MVQNSVSASTGIRLQRRHAVIAFYLVAALTPCTWFLFGISVGEEADYAALNEFPIAVGVGAVMELPCFFGLWGQGAFLEAVIAGLRRWHLRAQLTPAS